MQKDNKKLLGKRIKELRKQKGLKQEKLAELVGLEPTSISNIENGYNYPSMKNLEKISKILDVSLSNIFLFEHLQTTNNLQSEINKMLNENTNIIKDIYKITKALIS